MKMEVLQLWNRIDMMRALESEMRRYLLEHLNQQQVVKIWYLGIMCHNEQ